jgi:protein disulfide-isomerase A1
MTIQETKGADIDIVSVDCSAEAELCGRDGVSSFPAIRLRQTDGAEFRYRGARKAASLQGFLRRMSRPAVSYLTDENRTAFSSVDDFVFIGSFISNDSAHRRRFEAVAERYCDRYSFGLSEPSGGSVIVFNNNLDGGQGSTALLASGPRYIESYVKGQPRPLIPEMTRRNELSFYTVGIVNKAPNSIY